MLTRWEPFRETRRMHNLLDRLLDDTFFRASGPGSFLEGGLPIDVYQTEDEVIVKASAPGFKPEDIQISVTDDTLTLRGEISQEREEKDENGSQYYIRELRFGSFSRSIRLPNPVDVDKAKAEFENGVLTLTLPKAEGAKPKTITVKAKA